MAKAQLRLVTANYTPPRVVCRDTIQTLEDALARAKRGDITGVALIAFKGKGAGPYGLFLTGSGENHPTFTAGALSSFQHTVCRLMDE